MQQRAVQYNTEVKYGHFLVVIVAFLQKKGDSKARDCIFSVFLSCMQVMYIVLNVNAIIHYQSNVLHVLLVSMTICYFAKVKFRGTLCPIKGNTQEVKCRRLKFFYDFLFY